MAILFEFTLGRFPPLFPVITDNLGNILGDHYVEGVNENAEMLVNAPKWVGGIKLVAAPAGGSWTVNVRLR